MNFPTITRQQQALIHLLYKHRFLQRTQIQALFKHKDKRRINAWLKDLREKHYIEWIYNPKDFAEKTKPAIYHLDLQAIRYVRATNKYPPAALRKRYNESSRQLSFVSRCLLISDCCITLLHLNETKPQYTYLLETDYTDLDSEHPSLFALRPHFCFIKNDGVTITTYLMEIFETTTPRYMVKKRIRDYIEFLENPYGQDGTGTNSMTVVLLVCPNIADLLYAKRYIQKRLKEYQTCEQHHLRLATIESVKNQGVTAPIWEEA